MKIFIADDHEILLDGIAEILAGDPDICIAGRAADGKQALEALAEADADLLITDYHMPGINGLELIRSLKVRKPDVKIIVLSMHDEPGIIKAILKEGVAGYVLKTDTKAELKQAVKAARDGHLYLSSRVNRQILELAAEGAEKPILTPREHEILRLIAEELSNKEIGERLFISERTVETHRKNIFRKTGTHSIVGLMKFAYANKLI